jgi:hypothetical protein
MVGNDNPYAVAEVIEECNIHSFRTNPEWEEIIDVSEPEKAVIKIVKQVKKTKENV